MHGLADIPTSISPTFPQAQSLHGLRVWCDALQEGLPDCFNGVNLFEQDMTRLLRHQLPVVPLKLPSGKTKNIVPGLCGILSDFSHRWEQLCPGTGGAMTSPMLPNWTNGVPPRPVWGHERRLATHEERVAMQDLYAEYEAMGAIEKDPSGVPKFIMSNFPVTKKEPGQWRLVANSKKINPSLFYKHFKQEGLPHVAQTARRQDWFFSLDLRCAYMQLDAAPDFRRYFQFWRNGTLHRWTCLFFGAADAPRRFTKLILRPVSFLREFGGRCIVKIDDVLGMASSQLAARVFRNVMAVLLDWLGLQLNLPKSHLVPSQETVFLGTGINSITGDFTLTPEKATRYAMLAKSLLKACRRRTPKPVHVSMLRKIVGCIESTSSCVNHARLHSNWLRWSLREAQRSPTSSTLLPPEAQAELEWWVDLANHPEHMKKSFLAPQGKQVITIETDWSGFGYAACWVDEQGKVIDSAHMFVRHDSNEHNNEGELRGMLEGTHSLVVAHDWKNLIIVIKNDNIAGCSYVNKRGGRFAHLFVPLLPFFVAWESRNLLVRAEWIPGASNVNADTRSRKEDCQMETAVHHGLFSFLNKEWGPHTLDGFATSLNTQVPRYVSWGPDFRALGRDFFLMAPTLDSKEVAWLFPPYFLISRLLSLLPSLPFRVTLFVPCWPSQAWWPRLLTFLADFPVIVPAFPCLLTRARGQLSISPPSSSLIAVHLSTSSSTTTTFRRRLQRLTLPHLRQVLQERVLLLPGTTPSGGVSSSERALCVLTSSLSSHLSPSPRS